MKRYRMLLLLVAVGCLLASASLADGWYYPFSFPKVNPFDDVQFADFQMKQGFESKQLVWFICTDASDLKIACQTVQDDVFRLGLNFAPRLADLAGQVALVYIITNIQQGPVFTAVPGDPTYSGLWQIVYVTYKPGKVKHRVTNAAPFDEVTNPNGLPPLSDATQTTTNRAGNPIVVKYPIVAVGPLGGQWFPAPMGRYRIPQGKVDEHTYMYTKIVFLPFWEVYCRDPISKHVLVREIVIPDAFDPDGVPPGEQLVPLLRTNNAPGLGLIDDDDTQAFYWQLGPQPMDQFPILRACPSPWALPCANFDFAYTPVETVRVFQRNVPPLPVSDVITNRKVLWEFVEEGFLSPVRSTQVIDGTVLPLRYNMEP